MPIPGTNTDFHLDNASEALTEISAYLRSAKLGRSRDSAPTDTYGSGGDKEFLALQRGGSFTLEGIWEIAIDAILDHAYKSAVTKSFRYDPGGAGSGNISYTGDCWCTAYDISPPVDGICSFTATLTVTGAVGRAVL